ncbi:MAG: carbon starvation protein A [Candidatus Margulisbacteria bacterium]|nr:carbon starvation protein A [Candidatus Margulisiibacteriota bacterium]MBU1022059.1 carbon starvation protein A [Candidatus Margulisiibacteriota bacterium]MBU1729654.1 carbon starvation protein A [Candidatus Margulisiibacteriota bacterium]MBU1954974.1 carbon starvation protein A [Candidatus Margulisiibacteriota bacterium]
MNSVVIVIISLSIFLAGYKLYGSFMQKLWKVDFSKKTPAHLKRDNVDYVPVKHWTVLFGHHFASIAGAGPIIGPVIACAVFGWGPALLWIVFGSIFLGGVHDFSALMLSIRHEGNSVASVAKAVMGNRSKIIFALFLWLALVLVVAVFAAVTAATLIAEPRVVIPTFGMIAVAFLVGILLYRLKISQLSATLFGLILILVLIMIGFQYPLTLNFPQALTIWIVILMVYAYIASILPVQVLLQPRDYLSAFILFFGLIAGYAGIIISHPPMRAPVFISFNTSQGPLWPMMFVIIACGAISGFHSLIASGTTSKQLHSKAAVKRVSYGAMILEGVLSLLAVVSVCAGLYWIGGEVGLVYPTLMQEKGWIVAFSTGYGQLVAPLIGASFGSAVAMVTLNTFVLTTLDSATRINRYITEELFGDAFKIKIFKNRFASTALVALLALWLALGNWQAIWPIFGASNQLIAALVLIIASVYLFSIKRPAVYTLYPGIFMLITTIAALIYQMVNFFQDQKYLLFVIAVVLLILALCILIEADRVRRKVLSRKA